MPISAANGNYAALETIDRKLCCFKSPVKLCNVASRIAYENDMASSQNPKKRRTELTILEKVDLLDRHHKLNARSLRESAVLLEVSVSFLCQTLKKENEIRAEAAEQSTPSHRIRKRAGKGKEIEDGLKRWFDTIQARNAPVSGPILCQKAEQIATQLGQPDFKATDGWFHRWKKRNGLVFAKQHGEGGSADLQAANTWKEEEIPKLSVYARDCIYNADETAIYFRALPGSTYLRIEQKGTLRGFKTAKDRITALVCCNLAGEREKLLVIGKCEKPRCFKHVKTFPTHYKWSKNAWMTSTIWTEWLKQWNRRLVFEDKHILLLVDNCSAHIDISQGLSHITVKKLPPNTTSIVQPCDMGIIRTLKAHFRHEMRLRIIDMLEDGNRSQLTANDVANKLNVLDAMHMLSDAWRKVDQLTIVNCWRKADFKTTEETDQGNK